MKRKDRPFLICCAPLYVSKPSGLGALVPVAQKLAPLCSPDMQLQAMLSTGFLLIAAHAVLAHKPLQDVITGPTIAINDVPFGTRAFWMRRANAALAELVSPCPVGAFASVIVNHTAPGLGELVCVGVNSRGTTGNPTLHGECPPLPTCGPPLTAPRLGCAGEIAAIQNCTAIMTDPSGPFRFTPSEVEAAFAQLSLYTNAESCPMASIRRARG